MESNTLTERTLLLVEIGLLAVALLGCMPAPIVADAEYNPFADTITYYNGSEHNPQVVAHEEEHQKEAENFPYGSTFGWGLLYSFSPDFRCEAEKSANLAAKMFPIDQHPYCQK